MTEKISGSAGKPGRTVIGRRGAVAVMFAVAIVPMVIAVGTAIDVSRMIAGKAALQRIVDTAALTGAAAYTTYNASDSLKAVAVNVATSSFCNSSATLAAGFVTVASTGSGMCNSAQGPAVVGGVTAYKTGTRGTNSAAGCSVTNTVVTGWHCGFAVTVTATGRMSTTLANLFGLNQSVSATATAINPFIDLGSALTVDTLAAAANANSLWVYPLVLDADGLPDYSSNRGALPDHSTCTSDPLQFTCGVYTMLATNKLSACNKLPTCAFGLVNLAMVTGGGYKILNPVTSKAVITATTPLGFAMASAANADPGWYDQPGARRISTTTTPDGCKFPWLAVYNTYTQAYYADGTPQVPWTNVTHWFYTSYLANGLSPIQQYIDNQLAVTINPVTGHPYSNQDIVAVVDASSGANIPAKCTTPTPAANHSWQNTTFVTSGNTNCAVLMVQDAGSLSPDPSYKGSYPDYSPPPFKTCFSPNSTPGVQYAVMRCQNFKGHRIYYFWNDVSGKIDDTDYFNGTLDVQCSSNSQVVLIN